MSDEHPHPLLAQLPLTVSPFLSLPTATPLPYSYKTLPSTLPPSVTEATGAASGDTMQSERTRAPYVVSESGHAAHPDSIVESCRALQAHLAKLERDAHATLEKWNTDIRERELAEKRKVAPGWLDVDQSGRGLVPERHESSTNSEGAPLQHNLAFRPAGGSQGSTNTTVPTSESTSSAQNTDQLDEGNQLDRAFG